MVENDKRTRLNYFLSKYTIPLYVDCLDVQIFKQMEDATVLNANCSKEELQGNLENGYQQPKWFEEVSKGKILVINIENATIEEQARFIPILKDGAFQALKLPLECKVIVVNSKKEAVNNELLSCTLRV